MPSPPASGPGGHITYDTAALRRFAGTSDDRAAAFGGLHQRALDLKLGWNAFGVMFGQLTRAAYDAHVQTVAEGMLSAQQAMDVIAIEVQASADSIDSVNQGVEQDLRGIGG